MITFPRAKINIGLRITGKRHDGFHNIETLFYPVPLCDALEFVATDHHHKADILTVTGIKTGGEPEENLVMKAVKKLRENYSFPFLKMHLHKTIPAGAGLGGGSSDAAFILKGINRCYGLNLDDDRLKKIALELGSDCPFFIDCIPACASGRGEIILPCNKSVLKDYYILLVNPGIEVNTKEAYQNLRPSKPHEVLSVLTELPPERWKDKILNDFEEYVFARYPLIKRLKEDLYDSGALFSLMSGSGSTVYGIFSEKPELPDRLRNYIIWRGVI